MMEPKQRAVKFYFISTSILMAGLTVALWFNHHNWKVVLAMLVMSIIVIPLGYFRGMNMARGLSAFRDRRKSK